MAGLSTLVAAGAAFVAFRLYFAARQGAEKLRSVDICRILSRVLTTTTSRDSPGKVHWTLLSPFNFIVLLLGPKFPPRGWFAYFDGRFSRQ